MKIQFVVMPESGQSYHRLLNPMSFIKWDKDVEVEMLWYNQEESKINCDILIYHNYLQLDAKWIERLKKDGTKIVVDIDDMWEIPSWLYGKSELDRIKHTQRVIDNLRIADLVTCTTYKLQEKIRQYNKNTVVIPNAIPYGYEQFVSTNRQVDEEGKTRFIYVGGISHISDITAIEGKLRRIGSDSYLKANAKFIVAGYRKGQAKRYYTWHDKQAQNENFAWVPVHGTWDKIVTAFGHTGTCEVLPALSPLEYMSHYDHGDISIVPLQDKEWNSYKSTLKFAEAASRNLPVLCSKVPPYSEEKDVKGVIWVENNNWYEMTKWCVKNPNVMVEKGLELAEYCKDKYDLIKWAENRKQIYLSLLNSK